MYLDLEISVDLDLDHLCWPGSSSWLCNSNKCTLTIVITFRMYFDFRLVIDRKCDLCHDLDLYLDLEISDNLDLDHLCWPESLSWLCNSNKCTLTIVLTFRMYFDFQISY